jgi:two-component system, LytTR family, sensor kinase
MSTSPLSVTRFKIIFGISWLVVLFDTALLVKWFGWSWRVAFVDSFISTLILLLAALLLMNTLRYYTPRRERYLNLLIWCIFLTGIWLVLSRWLIKLMLRNFDGYEQFINDSIVIRASIGLLLLGCVTLIFVLWYNWEEQQKYEARKRDAEKLAKDAELYKLRQQLQPHFLFNSLNSINALIGIQPEEARKMVQQLSDFLRGTIRKEEQQWVTLQEELQYLQLYLDIEKVRFGNRLSTIIENDENTQQLKLPALLLQPIVENAIKFGLYDTTGDTVIRIHTVKQGNELIITVTNPFDPETSAPRKGTGFGLSSVNRRLSLLFGRTDLLSTATENNIFITRVKIPQHE